MTKNLGRQKFKTDENLGMTKIKGYLWNLFKKEVINFLSTCVYLGYIWKQKKARKRFFYKRDILKKY